MELVEMYLDRLSAGNGELTHVSRVEEADGIRVEVIDYSKRRHVFCIELTDDMEEYEDKISYYTAKAQDYEEAYLGLIDEPFKNKKQFASISACYNNFVRVLGL